ncbi:beta-propeller domain-containing protein [Candidatus Woesearchaeota archaeon]|nr:beta-propeller domain-containing protein [Candidatus Woesearchaeota archaeon]
MKQTNAICILTILIMGIFMVSCSSPDTTEKVLKKFSSEEELKDFLKNSDSGSEYYGGVMMKESLAVLSDMAAPTAQAAGAGRAEEYSTTNIQVEGVDEADIVKNDGKYIYVLTGNKIAIVDAYPAEDAELLSEIEIKGTPGEFFINGDKLVVFGTDYQKSKSPFPGVDPKVFVEEVPEKISSEVEIEENAVIAKIPFPSYTSQYSYALVYDISDKEEPKEEEKLILRGNYFNSRMIGDTVYMIVNEYTRYNSDILMPCIYSIKGETVTESCVPAPDIYYLDYPDSYEFSTIMAINLEDNSHSEKTILKGISQDMFVSQDNIFITFQKRMPYYYQQWRIITEVFVPVLPSELKERVNKIEGYDISENSKFNEVQQIIEKWMFEMTEEKRDELEKELEEKMEEVTMRIQKEMENTIIQKIKISGIDIELKGSGKVPGRVLNQFSMDEFDGYFRIATTAGRATRTGGGSVNNVYVLDSDMNIVGKLEDLAPGESIYSARFMSNRAYLVTFRKVDPLFVIDLEDPENPSVLGKLKIPGYSDYLHPYDEDHIIGIGKESIEAKEGDFSWYQGVKLALFDVSDVEKPKEISKYEIGNRGTESYALQEHKAFLFSKDKNLLVIPITLAEIDEEQYPDGVKPQQHGDFTFQGAYVFNLDLDDGFKLKGRITHVEDKEKFKKSGYYWYGSGENVKRSLYMDDVLYTISDSKIKMNDLDDIDDEINEVKLPYDKPDYMYGYME